MTGCAAVSHALRLETHNHPYFVPARVEHDLVEVDLSGKTARCVDGVGQTEVQRGGVVAHADDVTGHSLGVCAAENTKQGYVERAVGKNRVLSTARAAIKWLTIEKVAKDSHIINHV